jgi:hypothetical protein
MNQVENNVVVSGIRVKIGKLIFRQRSGQTIVSEIPEQSKPPTEKQAVQCKRFQQAIAYAKAAVESLETGKHHKAAAKRRKEKPLHHVAIAGSLHAPDIAKIDLTEYNGSIGDRIQIVISDDFAVKSLRIRITNADGSPVEEGKAVQSEEDVWTYTASQNNNNLDGGRIEVNASDWLGNVTEESYEL